MSKNTPEIPSFVDLLYNSNPQNPVSALLHHWDALVFSLISACLVALCFSLAAKSKNLIPGRLQNFVEYCVETLEKMVLSMLGSRGEKYLPFLGTLFIYILTMNWLGMIPLLKSPTSDVNTTIALALCVFVYVQYLQVKHWGILGYFYHLAGSPKGALGWCMVPLIFPLEVLSQLARPVTLAVRLWGNIMGEHILISIFALLGFMYFAFSYLSMPLQIPFLFFSLLTGLMQALVFTALSTVYILLSLPDQHKKE